jgi:hypothetical protein
MQGRMRSLGWKIEHDEESFKEPRNWFDYHLMMAKKEYNTRSCRNFETSTTTTEHAALATSSSTAPVTVSGTQSAFTSISTAATSSSAVSGDGVPSKVPDSSHETGQERLTLRSQCQQQKTERDWWLAQKDPECGYMALQLDREYAEGGCVDFETEPPTVPS